MKRGIANSGGGAAAVAPPLTFSGSSAVHAESAHLQTPTEMLLKFSKDPSKVILPPNLEHIKYQKLSTDKITIKVAEEAKCFKVLIGFKSSEELEKSKGLLKTCQFLSTNKGKTSNWKPEVSVVQPKKSEKKDESAIEKEDFPLGIFGDHYLSVQPMLQHNHRSLHSQIYEAFTGHWRLNDEAN